VQEEDHVLKIIHAHVGIRASQRERELGLAGEAARWARGVVWGAGTRVCTAGGIGKGCSKFLNWHQDCMHLLSLLLPTTKGQEGEELLQ
jgi:hypothetical protein